jgi:hypothetical protein
VGERMVAAISSTAGRMDGGWMNEWMEAVDGSGGCPRGQADPYTFPARTSFTPQTNIPRGGTAYSWTTLTRKNRVPAPIAFVSLTVSSVRSA